MALRISCRSCYNAAYLHIAGRHQKIIGTVYYINFNHYNALHFINIFILFIFWLGRACGNFDLQKQVIWRIYMVRGTHNGEMENRNFTLTAGIPSQLQEQGVSFKSRPCLRFSLA
jgi:hypothetical protein